MALPVFLRGLVCLLVAFALATYLITGSGWTTLIYTLLCAVLVQVGYFAAVLFLIWRSPRAKLAGLQEKPTSTQGRQGSWRVH